MAVTLRVAVCTNRSASDVADCLRALREQVAEPDLALVTSGLAGAEVATHEGAGATVLAEPRRGLARARNRALAWSGADDAVLAFVDDDALVDPGWRDALARRWEEAPAAVACIGGPIRPRFAVAPPGWYSPGIAHVLTLLDRGAEVRDLDPDEEAVYGANISFRVGPLRRAGGFDPTLGHHGSRPFFGEEDDAQRALARLGFRTRYVPDAGVEHVIPAARLRRRTFLERRFAFGRALARRDGRPIALAARQALASAAGAAAAALAGDDALAMERAVRAAENAGVVYASISPRRIA